MTDTGRGRQPRQADEQQERRRRRDSSLDATHSMNLAVPPEILAAHPDRDFYWANDIKRRLDQMHRNDWDKVDGVPPVKVDTVDGQPVYAVLHSKPKDFVREDAAEKEATRKNQERAMEKDSAHAESSLRGVSYAGAGNSINRGRAAG
jgi:hypothetical protein